MRWHRCRHFSSLSLRPINMDSDELNKRVKRRVYIPEDEDEYDAASKPLTGEPIFVNDVYNRDSWLCYLAKLKRGLCLIMFV